MMKNKKHFFLIFLFTAVLIFGARIWASPFFQEEFEVAIYQYPYMKLIANPASNRIDTRYTFINAENDFELRYSFFSQTKEETEHINRAFALFVIPIINDAVGYEVELTNIELYDNQDVAEEYNGDIGLSVFIPNPPSDYGSGYAFMLLSFFFKIGNGIVMQTILFDDIEFAGTEEFWEVSHTFRFFD